MFEFADHSLKHCKRAAKLWSLAFSLFGMLWILLYQFRDLLLSWEGAVEAKPFVSLLDNLERVQQESILVMEYVSLKTFLWSNQKLGIAEGVSFPHCPRQPRPEAT